ncbi:tetratricopeptide repeat protein [bacterium]|nr:tetratricopeptide repeat protein [bacterium]
MSLITTVGNRSVKNHFKSYFYLFLRDGFMKGLFFIAFLSGMLSLPVYVNAQAERKKVAEGNRLYSEEKYDEANNKYQDALLENPTSLPVLFNVGNVLYKKNDYEKALESYQKVLNTDDPLFQSQAYYNIGNTLYRSGNLAESILAYEQALKLNPEDQDAKYNLEFVRNKLKENAEPQSQGQQQQQGEQENAAQQNQEEQSQEEEEQQQAGEMEQQQEMTKEEAERLLDALKENQEEMQERRIQGEGSTFVEKDW